MRRGPVSEAPITKCSRRAKRCVTPDGAPGSGRAQPCKVLRAGLTKRACASETERAEPEKPMRGAGELEREMLEEIGDWEEFQQGIEEDLQ